MFLTVTGNTQGAIDGSCTIKGHENTMLIQALEHVIDIPKSPQTGLPTGKRVHGALILSKALDKASPKLFQALTSGEQLSEVKLAYYRIAPTGKEELYYTTVLKNAIITRIRTWVPNCLDPLQSAMGHMENIAFTYETIVNTWTPDGIEAEDSWNSPK